MAKPCGCSQGGCTAKGTNGICVTGTCGARDPLTIGLCDPLGPGCGPVMKCVGDHTGPGLEYLKDSQDLKVKISGDAGNKISYGSDTGLMSNGTQDPGLHGVTVDSLPTDKLILGSIYGAGYAIHPEGVLSSYAAAMANPNITMMQVPVRRGADGQLWALWNRDLSFYSNEPNPNMPIAAGDMTDEITMQAGRQVLVRPSGAPTGTASTFATPTYDARDGYFGARHPQVEGLPMLEDIFRVTQRRMVLYLECRDLGEPGDTPNPEATLRAIAALVMRWGLQKSVIVGAELPAQTARADLAGIKRGLQACRDAGIPHTAAHITTAAMATANPGADLVTAGFTWTMCNLSLGGATVTGYKTAGLNVMTHTCDRQHHWDATQSLDVRGALCSDPVYTGAHTYGFDYRLHGNTLGGPVRHPWADSAPDYGRTGNNGAVPGAHAKFRGYVDLTAPEKLVCNVDMTPLAAGSQAHIPFGRWCPIPDPNAPNPLPPGNYGAPTNYDIHVGVEPVTVANTTGGLAMGVFFGAPLDVRMVDLTAANANTKGYSFVLASNGHFVLRRYDGVAGSWQYQLDWLSGWGVWTPRVYGITVQVRPGTIRVGPTTDNGGITGANSRLFDLTTGGGDLHRGPYGNLCFLRGTFNSALRFASLRVTPGP